MWGGSGEHAKRGSYHPLFCFNQFGDMERPFLRNGNVHSADNWQSVLEPIIARYRSSEIPRFFRGDAGFADPEIYRFLESEDYVYVIRLKGNQILYGKIEHLLTRPVGRPPKKPIVAYHSFRYQAASWDNGGIISQSWIMLRIAEKLDFQTPDKG
ncbi:MAG: transposase [Planctomycetes bacterium]|nr:transposase [Planctomycetota bacterium]